MLFVVHRYYYNINHPIFQYYLFLLHNIIYLCSMIVNTHMNRIKEVLEERDIKLTGFAENFS